MSPTSRIGTRHQRLGCVQQLAVAKALERPRSGDSPRYGGSGVTRSRATTGQQRAHQGRWVEDGPERRCVRDLLEQCHDARLGSASAASSRHTISAGAQRAATSVGASSTTGVRQQSPGPPATRCPGKVRRPQRALRSDLGGTIARHVCSPNSRRSSTSSTSGSPTPENQQRLIDDSDRVSPNARGCRQNRGRHGRNSRRRLGQVRRRQRDDAGQGAVRRVLRRPDRVPPTCRSTPRRICSSMLGRRREGRRQDTRSAFNARRARDARSDAAATVELRTPAAPTPRCTRHRRRRREPAAASPASPAYASPDVRRQATPPARPAPRPLAAQTTAGLREIAAEVRAAWPPPRTPPAGSTSKTSCSALREQRSRAGADHRPDQGRQRSPEGTRRRDQVRRHRQAATPADQHPQQAGLRRSEGTTRIARQLGGGITAAKERVADARFEQTQARLEAAPATLTAGGRFQFAGVVININGVTDPAAVANRVAAILKKRQAHHHPVPRAGSRARLMAGISLAPRSDWNDPAPTWDRIDNDYNVQSWSIDRGRPNEMSRTDTGQATVELVDRTGDFDPTNTGGAFYGGTSADRQAKIELQNQDTDAWSTLFRGFIASIRWMPYRSRATRQRHPRAGRRARPVGRLRDGPGRDVRRQRRRTRHHRLRRGHRHSTPSKPGSTRCSTRPAGPARSARIFTGNVGAAEGRVRAPLNRPVGDPGRRRRRVPRRRQRLRQLRVSETSRAEHRRRPTRLAHVPRPVRPLQPRSVQYNIQTWQLGDDTAAAADADTVGSRRRWSRRSTTRCSTRRLRDTEGPGRDVTDADFAGQYVTDPPPSARKGSAPGAPKTF